jgi:ribosomal protein L31
VRACHNVQELVTVGDLEQGRKMVLNSTVLHDNEIEKRCHPIFQEGAGPVRNSEEVWSEVTEGFA